jgi:hypothetical protein
VLDGDASSGFVFKSPSYHHQGFPQNCQLEFEWCPEISVELMVGREVFEQSVDYQERSKSASC